jgi:hypothetical protein
VIGITPRPFFPRRKKVPIRSEAKRVCTIWESENSWLKKGWNSDPSMQSLYRQSYRGSERNEHSKETICHLISQLSWAGCVLSCRSTSTPSKGEILPVPAVECKESEAISYNFLSCISSYYNKEGTIKYAKYAGLDASVLNFIVSSLIPFIQTMNVRYSTLENFLRRTSKFCYSQKGIWSVQHWTNIVGVISSHHAITFYGGVAYPEVG